MSQSNHLKFIEILCKVISVYLKYDLIFIFSNVITIKSLLLLFGKTITETYCKQQKGIYFNSKQFTSISSDYKKYMFVEKIRILSLVQVTNDDQQCKSFHFQLRNAKKFQYQSRKYGISTQCKRLYFEKN